MNDNLEQLVSNLKLRKIQEILGKELERAQKEKTSYTDLLERLFRQEYLDRVQRAVEYRVNQAKLPERWSLQSFPFKRQKGVNPAQIRQLGELDFMAHAQNLVFIGKTGVGKTGLATGLLLRAIENGYRGIFIRAQDLFDEMYASLADRSTRTLLNRLARVDALLIDELGYLNLRPEQSNIFFKLMEERYNRHSTLITTNLEYEQWYSFLGNKSMVAALLDRLRHHCITINIEGPSLRNPES